MPWGIQLGKVTEGQQKGPVGHYRPAQVIVTAIVSADYLVGAAAFLLGLDALLAGAAAGLRDCGFTLASLTGVVGWSKVAPSGTIQTSTLFSSAVLVRASIRLPSTPFCFSPEVR